MPEILTVEEINEIYNLMDLFATLEPKEKGEDCGH